MLTSLASATEPTKLFGGTGESMTDSESVADGYDQIGRGAWRTERRLDIAILEAKGFVASNYTCRPPESGEHGGAPPRSRIKLLDRAVRSGGLSPVSNEDGSLNSCRAY
jgi:hypothetical protein